MNSASRSKLAIMQLRYYYLFDDRPFCVAYSGGKDSTVVVDLALKMLIELRDTYNHKLLKPIHIVNSNTIAELPPVLEYVQESLQKIKRFCEINNLQVVVQEVKPDIKHTLNVQLFGVGMPPPTSSFRWCTTKLKVMPIEKYLQNHFAEGRFISVIGSRSAESHDRASRLANAARKGTNLKFNTRYKNASNLAPIEDWSVQNVWEYLFELDKSLIDTSFLWKLYSDASGKDTTECSFVGAGGKHIDEGKIGCGVSRFGCWQCYITRENDKSLDGLYKSGYENVEYFKEFRDWFWNETQKGWEHTRDVYSHNRHTQDLYNKGSDKKKLGMTMPKGLRLDLRKKAFAKIMDIEQKITTGYIVTEDEIYLIQDRWLKEGDIELSALKIASNVGRKLNHAKVKNFKFISQEIKNIYDQLSHTIIYSELTLKRKAAQIYFSPKNVHKQFYPTIKEESHIRLEWKMNSKLEQQPNNEVVGNYILIKHYSAENKTLLDYYNSNSFFDENNTNKHYFNHAPP